MFFLKFALFSAFFRSLLEQDHQFTDVGSRRSDCPTELPYSRLSIQTSHPKLEMRASPAPHGADLSCLSDEPVKYAAFCAMQGLSDAVDRKYAEYCFPVASSTRPIRTTALAQATTVRFTRNVAVRHKPENKNTKESRTYDHNDSDP